MDVAKRIIDHRINKILEDNPAIFNDGDMERNRSRAFLLLGGSAYLDIDMAESAMADILKNYFGQDDLAKIDGRTMAAAFRRFDILERYLKRESWWEENM